MHTDSSNNASTFTISDSNINAANTSNCYIISEPSNLSTTAINYNDFSLKTWSKIGDTLATKAVVYTVKDSTTNKKKLIRPYYRLKMCVNLDNITKNRPQTLLNEDLDALKSSIVNFYSDSVTKNTELMNRYKSGEKVLFDAGVDLFMPYSCVVNNDEYAYKLDHCVRCSMEKVEDTTHGEVCNPVGYYLYPRSSMGTKTPLSLTNSVGIIDSGYRGSIIAAVHCTRNPSITESGNWRSDEYEITQFQRLVQLCPPDLSYPVEIVLVDNEDKLGDGGVRGEGGFGSTGV